MTFNSSMIRKLGKMAIFKDSERRKMTFYSKYLRSILNFGWPMFGVTMTCPKSEQFSDGNTDVYPPTQSTIDRYGYIYK